MDEQSKIEEQALWTIHKAESGQTYYYNLKTGESQWEKPLCLQEAEEEEQDEWQEYHTDDGRSYWYNFKTKESKWQKPSQQEILDKQQMAKNVQEEQSDEEIPPDPTLEFFKMFRDKEIPITMKWDQAVKALSNDNRWNCIKSISEKKKLFNDYMAELKKTERDEQKVRLSYAKEEFFKMLDEYKINSSDKKFWQVASALVNDPRWKAIPEEKERENLFQDHLDKLYEQERENTRHQRKTSTEDFKKKLQRYVESKMIDHTTTWDQCLKLFSQDRLLQIMMPVDALGVFEEVINPLYEQWRNATRQKYRNNRIQLREFLHHNLAQGILTHKTKWKDFVQNLRDDERFLCMVGQPGSQAHELFSDFMSILRQNHQLYKSELKMVLKQRGVKTLEGVQFEQFNNLFIGNDAWNKMANYEQMYYFRYFQENIKNKDLHLSGPKRQKKILKRFNKLLRQLPLVQGMRYEQMQKIIDERIVQDFPKLQSLNDDTKRNLFDQYVDNLPAAISIQGQEYSISKIQKKKKKKNKKHIKEDIENIYENNSYGGAVMDSESDNTDNKRRKIIQKIETEIEPTVDKLTRHEERKIEKQQSQSLIQQQKIEIITDIITTPPVIQQAMIQEEEDGEINEAPENDLKDGMAMDEELRENQKSISHQKKKHKSSSGKHGGGSGTKHKHTDDYSRRQEKADKSSKHTKKQKQNYK